MKIRLMFQDTQLGTARCDPGSGVVYCDGKGVLKRVNSHARKSGKGGEELLRLLLTELRGHTWAEEVEDVEEPGAFPDLAAPQRGDRVGRAAQTTEEE